MIPRRRLPGGLLLAALALLCAASRGDNRPDRKVHDSPEAVFKVASDALKNDDVKAFMGCLSSDSQTLMTGQIAFGALMLKGAAALDATGKAAEKVKLVNAVFTRHGLTEEKIRKLKLSRDPKDLGKSLRAIGGMVKDRVAFAAELVAALGKADAGKAPGTQLGSKLTDLKIDGDRARGSVVTRKDGKEKKNTIAFVRVDGGWKIVLPEPEAKPAPAQTSPPGKAPPKPGEGR